PQGGKTWEIAKGAQNREDFRKLIETGRVYGVLAFVGDEPVGWCSFGPRDSFPRLERVKGLQSDWSERTWSIVCFYIPAPWRGKGVATCLIEAATKQALELGAHEIEGYPIVPEKAPVKIPAAFAWTGVSSIFDRAGYRRRK